MSAVFLLTWATCVGRAEESWTGPISRRPAGMGEPAGDAYEGASEFRSEHFVVLTFGRAIYAREVLRRAESCYTSIARRLGYDRYEKFWTWEERCRILLYPDKTSYVSASRGAAWTEGYANFRRREIVSYENDTQFLERVLPHEISHLILHDFLGAGADIPLWFDEGIALSQEESAHPVFHLIAVQAIRQGGYVPIQGLASRVRSGAVAYRTVELFYAQASYLMDYWIDHFPRGKFVEFLRTLRLGIPFEEAFEKIFAPYGVKCLQDLEARMIQEAKAGGHSGEQLAGVDQPMLDKAALPVGAVGSEAIQVSINKGLTEEVRR